MSIFSTTDNAAMRPSAQPDKVEVDAYTKRGSVEADAAVTAAKRSRGWTILEYRNYSPFTWSWSWRRSIVFGVFAIAFAAWRGISNALLLDDWRLGLLTASLFIPLTLIV